MFGCYFGEDVLSAGSVPLPLVVVVWVARSVCVWSQCLVCVYRPSVPPVRPPVPLTNSGAAFQQCPLSKRLYCGERLTLLCGTKPRSQWNNPAGRRPPPGSLGAAGPQPKQPTWQPGAGRDSRAGNTLYECVCVCWQRAGSKVQQPRSLIYQQNRFFKYDSSLRSVLHLSAAFRRFCFDSNS